MKKRILHFIGVQAIRAAAIVIMLALTVGSMMYLRGYFDFTFIDRVPLNADTAETESFDTEAETEPPSPETEPVTEAVGTDTEELPSQDNPPVQQTPAQNPSAGSAAQTTVQRETAKTASDAIKSVKTLQSQGYKVQTSGIYQRGSSVLAKLPLSGLGKNYSYSQYEVRDVRSRNMSAAVSLPMKFSLQKTVPQ